MKKKIAVTIVAALLCVGLAACGGGGKDKGYDDYPKAEFPSGVNLAGKDYDEISIKYPDSWTVGVDIEPDSAQENSSFFLAAAPADANGNMSNVNIVKGTKEFKEVSEFTQTMAISTVKQAGDQLGTTLSLKDFGYYRHGEKDVLRMSYEGELSGFSVKFVQLYSIGEECNYVITATVIGGEHEAELEAVLSSLEFK